MAQLLQSPWVSGFSTIADALVQAPGNRAKALYAQQQAANLAADNARADEQLRIARDNAQRQADQWAAEQKVRLAGEGREAALHPGAVEKQGLDIASGEIANEFARENNPIVIGKNQADLDYATENNPLLIRKNRADADTADMAANVEGARITQMPDLAAAVTDQAYQGIHAKMPAWSVKDMLQPPPEVQQFTPTGEPIPPPPSLPGVADVGMDYANGDTAAMDEMSRRMGVQENLRTQADTAVLDKGFNGGDWVKKQVDAGIAAEPNIADDPTDMYGDTDKGRAQAVIADIREKQRNNIPLTPADIDNYDMAIAVLNPKTVSTIMGDKGAVTNITETELFTGGPGAPQSQTQPPVSQAGVQTQPPVSQTAPGVPTRTQSANGVTVTTIGDKGRKPLTEYNSKVKVYGTRAGTALQQFAPLIGLDLENNTYDPSKAKVSGVADSAQMWADRKATELIGPEARGVIATGPQEQYSGAQTGMLNPLVRFDSGAATPEIDYGRAGQEFIPGPNDAPEAVVDKIVRTRAVLAAMEEILTNTGIDPSTASDDQIRQWKAEGLIDSTVEKYRMLYSQEPPTILSPATAPAPAAPAQNEVVPPGWDPEDWKYLSADEKASFQ